MDTTSIFTLSLLLLSLILLTKLLTANNKKNHNINLPPTIPNSHFLFGHLNQLQKPLHQSLARLSSLHGPILLLRFGVRRVLVVSSASLADECFTTNDLAFANRPKFPSNRVSTYNYSGMGVAPYGPMWRDMRRVSNLEILSGHRLAFFAEVRASEARALARRLFRETAFDAFKKVELKSRLFGFAVNVMMMMMAGKRYYGEEFDDGETVRIRGGVEEGLTFSGAANVGDFLPLVIGWFARLKVQSALAKIHSYSDKFIQGLLEESTKKMKEEGGEEDHRTMIDALLSLQRSHPEQYDDSFIKSLIKV